MKTQFLAIIHIITYEDKEMSYPVGTWGTKDQAEKSLAKEKEDCGGYVLSSYIETRSIKTENALTKNQQNMLMILGEKPSDLFNRAEWENANTIFCKNKRTLILRGHQIKTARALESKGLVRVFSSSEYNLTCGVCLAN